MGIGEAALVVVAIVGLEALLSADNAMVLAVIVRPLSPALRRKALLYGLAGAYLLRALALVFAAFIIKLWWVEILGGLYLAYLAADHFRNRAPHAEGVPPERPSLPFWRVVVDLNLINLAFSIDSILVVVAFTRNLALIIAGVFIGMAMIWLAANLLVKLLDRYPVLESVAYALVGWAGVKLALEGWAKLADEIWHRPELAPHMSQGIFWAVTLLILLGGSLLALRAGQAGAVEKDA
ncbi:MAG: tellurium resistance protein TerC [Deinococcus sp.]|nr:tellurium resistance protein TerC [Deinococcus sp.]